MKIDELIFFIYCYTLRNLYGHDVRSVVDIFKNQIHRKRCWYLLKKWSRLGFYNYGVTLDLGWFEYYKMPERYKAIVDNVCNFKEE